MEGLQFYVCNVLRSSARKKAIRKGQRTDPPPRLRVSNAIADFLKPFRRSLLSVLQFKDVKKHKSTINQHGEIPSSLAATLATEVICQKTCGLMELLDGVCGRSDGTTLLNKTRYSEAGKEANIT